MNSRDIQAVEELLNQKIHSLEQVINTRLNAGDKALELQHKEYERRLDALNGEAERLHQMQLSYVNKEVYERDKERVQQDVKSLQSWRDTQIGKHLAISAGVSLLIAGVVSAIIAFMI